jgi:hypothetical protein
MKPAYRFANAIASNLEELFMEASSSCTLATQALSFELLFAHREHRMAAFSFLAYTFDSLLISLGAYFWAPFFMPFAYQIVRARINSIAHCRSAFALERGRISV